MSVSRDMLLRERSWLIAGLALGMLAARTGWAQQAVPEALLTCPATTSIDQLPKAIDDAVSGPGNKDRVCMRLLFLPEAHLIPVSASADGQTKTTFLTVDDYVEHAAKRGDKAFYERQIKYATETYGNIAHLWSTYEIRETPDGKAILRGINSIEAIKDGGRWKVLEISWQAERPENPLPAHYLP